MAQGQPVTYRVTTVTTDTQFNGQSSPTAGKRVTFETSTGYTGSVFVPDGVFGDAKAVRDIIEAEVRLVAAAQSISGSITG